MTSALTVSTGHCARGLNVLVNYSFNLTSPGKCQYVELQFLFGVLLDILYITQDVHHALSYVAIIH